MLTLASLDIVLLVAELLTLGIVVYAAILLYKLAHNLWPMVECPASGDWAIHHLRDIMKQLYLDPHPSGNPKATPAQIATITMLVQACMDHTIYVAGPHSAPDHCAAVANALTHAQAAAWEDPPNNCCVSELCHGA